MQSSPETQPGRYWPEEKPQHTGDGGGSEGDGGGGGGARLSGAPGGSCAKGMRGGGQGVRWGRRAHTSHLR